jgi:hypothetical protein
MKAALERAQRNIKAIDERYAVIEKQFQEMVRVKMDKARLTKYLTLVFKDPPIPKTSALSSESGSSAIGPRSSTRTDAGTS